MCVLFSSFKDANKIEAKFQSLHYYLSVVLNNTPVALVLNVMLYFMERSILTYLLSIAGASAVCVLRICINAF